MKATVSKADFGVDLIFKVDPVPVGVALTHWWLEMGIVKISAVVGHLGAATRVVPIDAEVGH